MASARLSLAQQIAQLESVAPPDLDPDAIFSNAPESEDPTSTRADESIGGDVHAGRDHYLEVGRASRRLQHDSISDPKYDGMRVSRTQIMEDEDEEQNSESEEFNQSPSDEDNQNDNQGDRDDGEADNRQNLVDGGQEVKEMKSSSNATSQPPPPSDLSATIEKTQIEERKKGIAVSHQMAIYDNVLDARIRLQKCTSSANGLPNPSALPSYLLNEQCRQSAEQFLKEATALTQDLFEIRETLLRRSDLSLPSRKKRKLDLESSVEIDWEEEITTDTAHSASLESTLHPHLLTTLQKWSSKILAVAPSALLPSNRTKFSRTPTNQMKSATQLIQEILSEKDKLVTRTRTYRGKTGTRLGPLTHSETHERQNDEEKEQDDDKSPEIFDDTDFYQQQLRDVIDARSGSGGLPGGEDHWRLIQKQKKAKKVVDTRASKGRKLRFDVHEKLQNFMVSVPVPGAWHEEQIDELFASLLGNGFERSLPASMNVDVEQPMRTAVDSAIEGGFRVFG